MRYGSVCSGIEAATVAWHPLGWEAAWYSEIEPFPCAVLKHHYPAVPNYGDMTKYEEWPDEPINLLVGGTPCQSFSVAGLRKGLADPRGNLMLTYGAIARRYRPEWLVWENVPGVLSSNGGRDFGTFLGMLAELGYGFAYRVLDAQYFGVAQRRRRVFVVANARSWQRAAAVLFESHSLQGHPAPSREAREGTAQCLTAGVGKRYDPTTETLPVVAETLIASDHKGPGHNRDHNFIAEAVAFPWQSALDPIGQPSDVSGTLIKNQTMAVAQSITQFGSIAGSLTARHDSSPCADRGQNVVAQPVAMVNMQGSKSNAVAQEDGPSYTLNAMHGHDVHVVAQPVAFKPKFFTRDNPKMEGAPNSSGTIGTLLTNDTGDNAPHVATTMQVRRLTPVECERLQGFPDSYTNIPWRKKPESPDGPRYKALGNSMAVPVMAWIGKRIQQVSEL